MVIVIGEILIDIFPDDRRIGGAPFNFAFHLRRLGIPVRFLTRVGDDADGRQILDRLQTAGFDPADVQIDHHHPTGTVQVELDDGGVPHFTICEDVAYDHLLLSGEGSAQIPSPQMIYFGSLIQRSDAGHREVQQFLDAHGETATRFCDINLRPPHINDDALADCLRRADLLKLSSDELTDILERRGGPSDAQDGIAWLMETYAIQWLAVTRGDEGSTFTGPEGTLRQPAEQPPSVADTVGAGDAYAAVLAAGLLRELPWRKTLQAASRFSARICSVSGAVPDDANFYDDVREAVKGNTDGR